MTEAFSDALLKSGLKFECHSNISNNRRVNKRWFNGECVMLKKETYRLLRACRKNKFVQPYLNNYLTAKKQYRKIKSVSKTNYFEDIKIKLGNVSNSKEFWKIVNSLNCTKSYSECPIAIETWDGFLNNIYKSKPAVTNILDDKTHHFLDRIITMDELVESIANTKANKAPGPDTVINECYKLLPPNWLHYILNIFNNILELGKVPTSWGKIKFKMIFKKGCHTDPNNYRGIALINNIVKIFTRIISKRLNDWVEERRLVPEEQMGFREGRGCRDAIFTLQAIINIHLRNKRSKVFGIFIDFKRAFDSISHEKLWYKLNKIHIYGKTLNALKDLYKNAWVLIESEGEVTKEYNVTEGVLQGENLSPLLFSLFIQDIETFFRDHGAVGVSVDERRDVLMLQYADDMVILGYSQRDVRFKLDLLHKYCELNELTVNTDKTKVLPFHKGAKLGKHSFYYNNRALEIVNCYKYLGIIFTSNGKFKKASDHSKTVSMAAVARVKQILSKGKSDSWHTKEVLFDSLIRSVLLYCGEVWAPPYAGHLEKVQITFLKSILQLPRSTPDALVRYETSSIHLDFFVFKRLIKWWLCILSMPDDRLPKICYNRLYSLTDNSKLPFNWCKFLRDCLGKIGRLDLWKENNRIALVKSMEDIIFAYRNHLIGLDLNRVYNTRYNAHIRCIMCYNERQAYLGLRIPFECVRVLAQLRLSCGKFPRIIIEGNKYDFKPENNCVFCDSNMPDSLEHFLLDCRSLDLQRVKYLSHIGSIGGASSLRKLDTLLNSTSVTHLKNLFLYLKVGLASRISHV